MGLASASEQQELQNDAQYCILTIPDAYAIIYNEEIWSLVKKTEKTVRLVKKIKENPIVLTYNETVKKFQKSRRTLL